MFKFLTVVIIVFTEASKCPENTVGNGVSCADINECEDTWRCAPNERCINEWGSFSCEEDGMESFQCPQGERIQKSCHFLARLFFRNWQDFFRTWQDLFRNGKIFFRNLTNSKKILPVSKKILPNSS